MNLSNIPCMRFDLVCTYARAHSLAALGFGEVDLAGKRIAVHTNPAFRMYTCGSSYASISS